MPPLDHHTADLLWESPGSDIEILSMSVRQAISEPYIIRAQIKHPSPDLNFADMLNAEARIVLKCGPQLSDDRIFSGIISRLVQRRTRFGNLPNATSQSYLYDVEIRPKLWKLAKQFRSCVYQSMTVQEIASEILDAHGVSHQWNLGGSLRGREYVVQYQETDLNFVSRLVEEEGICYYFNQEENKIVFSDHAGGHEPCSPVSEATYVEEVSPRMQVGEREFIRDFDYEEALGTGKFGINHYNYETSQQDLLSETEESEVPCFTEMERYEHTHNFVDSGEGSTLVDLRKEEEVAHAKIGRGNTSCRSFEAGYTMSMSGHFRGDLNCGWLLTTCHLHMEQGVFNCDFTCLQADVVFRPRRKTKRPHVAGIQTGIVTGPSGSKVFLDDMGRCKVQFHWDREGEHDDRSSMWVRVSNNYAGKDYGIQWIPRVGHEVLVTFIDGNPDLPIVTGRVYHDVNTAPLGSSKKYQNIIKTIKDNHILFDDSDGGELVEIRAQRNMKKIVVRNETQHVGINRRLTVGVDRTEEVGNDMTVTIGNNLTESVGATYVETVGADMVLTVGGSHTESVGGAHSETIGATDTIAVGTNRSLAVGAAMSTVVGATNSRSVGASESVTCGANHILNAGSNVVIKAGGKVTIVAASSVAIQAGGSMTLSAKGNLSLSGSNVKISAKGGMTLKAAKISEN